jgi:O-antigen/teichoic acid export membrane protein
VAGVFGSVPITVIPLLILSLLGPESAAYFYMAYSLGSMLTFITNSVTTSLFAEGSHDEGSVGKNISAAIRLIFLLLIPAITGLVLFGNVLLSLIGRSYSTNAEVLLFLIALSSLPYSIIQIYTTIFRIRMDIKKMIYINFASMVLLIVTSYLSLIYCGLNGIGIAWILSYVVVVVILLIMGWRGKILTVDMTQQI